MDHLSKREYFSFSMWKGKTGHHSLRKCLYLPKKEKEKTTIQTIDNVVKQIMLHNCKVTCHKCQCHFIEKILILYCKHGRWGKPGKKLMYNKNINEQKTKGSMAQNNSSFQGNMDEMRLWKKQNPLCINVKQTFADWTW